MNEMQAVQREYIAAAAHPTVDEGMRRHRHAGCSPAGLVRNKDEHQARRRRRWRW
jgi:hypothetical protein